MAVLKLNCIKSFIKTPLFQELSYCLASLKNQMSGQSPGISEILSTTTAPFSAVFHKSCCLAASIIPGLKFRDLPELLFPISSASLTEIRLEKFHDQKLPQAEQLHRCFYKIRFAFGIEATVKTVPRLRMVCPKLCGIQIGVKIIYYPASDIKTVIIKQCDNRDASPPPPITCTLYGLTELFGFLHSRSAFCNSSVKTSDLYMFSGVDFYLLLRF